MLERLIIRNFKTFDDVEIELGETVVFIGPNNAGKTTALQALALWQVGLSKWSDKRTGPVPEKRPGVTINRRDVLSLPVPGAQLLWKDLRIRESGRDEDGKQWNRNVRIEVLVHGIDKGNRWQCGLEFDYANSESFYCRPLRLDADGKERMPVPDEALQVRVAFLPPMSGLAATEYRLDPGAVDVLLGEGRTAEVLRNLCYQVFTSGSDAWGTLQDRMRSLFGISLDPPEYIGGRGELTVSYSIPPRDGSGGTPLRLDLSTSGRGLQQTLLLLSYIQLHPGAVILLDEPDAHLEILRQRQIYAIITELAQAQRCQIVAASHSEVMLNEAADRDVVIAFVGRPHRIDDRGSQVVKSLKSIGFEQYYQAEQQGWVLYLEGATDLAILQAFARILEHPAREHLERPFVHYVENKPNRAREHFFGLREAKRDLVGLLQLDRLDAGHLRVGTPLEERTWRRREIENYLCFPEVLEAYARQLADPGLGPLFEETEKQRLVEQMRKLIELFVPRIALQDPRDDWWHGTKASDDFLDRLFRRYFEELGMPNLMSKTDYHRLAIHVPRHLIDPEVEEVLDAIARVANSACPTAQPDCMPLADE